MPTQSISGHGVRDGRHVVVGSAPPEPRLLRIASQPLGSLGQTVCLPGLVWRNGASTLALMLRSIAGEASTDVPQSHSLRCVSKHEEGRTGSSSSFKKINEVRTRLDRTWACCILPMAAAAPAYAAPMLQRYPIFVNQNWGNEDDVCCGITATSSSRRALPCGGTASSLKRCLTSGARASRNLGTALSIQPATLSAW